MSNSFLSTRKKTIKFFNLVKKLSRLLCLMAFFVGPFLSFGQATLPIINVAVTSGSSTMPTGFTQSGLGTAYASTTTPWKLDNQGDYVVCNFTGTAGTLTFKLTNNGLSGSYQFDVLQSTDGTTYTNLQTITSITSTQSFTISSIALTTRYIKWTYTTKSSGNVGLGTIGMTALSTAPTILGSATTSIFTTTYGTASAAQTFSISGSNLTDSLKAIAPYGFELSLDSTNYTDSVAIIQASGTAAGRLSIRMKSIDSVNGSYNSKNIVLKSIGATSVNITTPASGNLVSAKTITIIGLTASNKNYDGTKTVSIIGFPIYNGLVNGQVFSVSDIVTWSFSDSLVGNNKILTRTGPFISPSSNYTIIQPVLIASILAVVPGAPTIGSAIAGNTQATLSFSPPIFTGGVNINNYTVTSSPSGITANGSSSPITITGLTNGTAYTFTVVANNIAGNSIPSAASNSATPTSDPIVPNVPTAVNAVAGNAQATVTFLAPASDGGSAILSYTVTSNPGNISVTAAASPIIVTGLTNGIAYSFTVVATNIIGSSLSSSPSNNVTPIAISDSPTISSITIGNKQLSVQFNAPSSNGGSSITNYKYSINNGVSFVACSPTQITSPIIIKGLTNGVSYGIKILAVNNAGDGIPSNLLTATPATNPGVPIITGIMPGNALLSVAFTPPSSDSGSAILNYKYSINGGTTFISCSPAQTTSPIIITGLVNGTSNDVQIKAVNAIGDGVATATTTATPLLSAPIARAASPIGSTSFTANWDSVPGATSYRLDVSSSTVFESNIIVLNEGFENSTFPPTGWVNSSWSRSLTGSDINSGSAAAIANSNSGSLTTSAVANPTSMTFYLGRSSNTTSKQLTIDVSTTSQSTGFTTIATFDHSNVPVSSYNQYSVDLSAYSSYASVYIRFTKTSSTTSPWRLDDVVMNSTLSNYILGYQNLTVSGTSQLVSGLTNGATYYYRVRAYSANNTSINSNVKMVTTNSNITQPPVLVPATRATVDSAFKITFIEDSTWRNSITNIKVGGVTLATSAYTITTPGEITFIPSASSLLQSSGTKSIVFVAADYANDTLSQPLLAGVAKNLAITIQPTAPATNGTVLAVQPVIALKDQYGNFTTSNALITASSTDTSVWRIGGSVTINAVSGFAIFSGLAATSTAAVTGATIFFSSFSLNGVISNPFNIPAPTPVNDNCSGAINLNINTNATIGNVTGATQSIAAISCSSNTGNANDDLWYKFTTTMSGTYTITVVGSSSFDAVLELRSGTCNGTNISCIDATNSGGTETITSNMLTSNTTYYARVYDYSSGYPANPTFTISVAGPAVYYSKSSGNLNKLSTWGVNTDGSGTAPSNFTASNQTFIIKNNLSSTIDSAWIVSGTNSKIILGDSVNTYNFTIPSAYALTGTIDVTTNAILTIQNTTNPTFGILSAMSTIDFASLSSQTISSANYANITNTGNGPRVLASSGTIGIAGNYYPSSGTITTIGSTINFNGTAAQTIPASNYNNITTSNASGCTTAGNVILGNILTVNQQLIIGAASTLTMLPGDSVIIAALKNLTVSATGKIQNNSTRIFNFNTTGSMTVNGVYVHNANAQTIPSSTFATYGIGSVIKVGDGGTNITTVNPILPATAYDVVWDCPAQTQTNIFISSTPTNVHDLNIISTGTGYIANGLTSNPRVLNISGNLSLIGGNLNVIGNGTNTANQIINVTGNLTVSGGKLDLNAGLSTSNSIINLLGNLIHTGGVITETNTSTGVGSFVFKGTSPQTISTLGLSNGINVTINNASGVTLNTDVTVADTLNFITGKIITGNNKLISTGTIFGAGAGTGWVAGNLKKKISNTGIKNFEIGGTNYYRPVNINITALVDTGSITAFVSQQDNNHPNLNSSNISTFKTLKRYFNLTKSNTLAVTYNALFNYNAADIPGVFDTSKLIVGNYNSSWAYPTVGSKTNTSIQIVNTNTFGDFAIGETNQFDSINLHIKAFLEGYYLAAGLMTATLNDPGIGPLSNDASATDSIIISLWKPDSLTNPTPVYRSKTILHTNGDVFLSLSKPRFLGNSYYISINHRNSIETWSAAPVALSSNTISYDFTTSASQAYGDGTNSPLKNVENGVYVIYGGDVNQDGTVDGSDMGLTENDVSAFEYGYNTTDCTGDGATDGSDMTLIENNTSLFLFSATPRPTN